MFRDAAGVSRTMSAARSEISCSMPLRGKPLPFPVSRSSAMLASAVKGRGQFVAADRPPAGL